MKHLIIVLLFSTSLLNHAHATTPNECLEIARGYWVAMDSMSDETEFLLDRFIEKCVPEDYSEPVETTLLIQQDEHIQGLILDIEDRLTEMGVSL